jgi:predicted GTPase
MGYGAEQLRELEETINATDCDVVVTGTPMDLGRLIDVKHLVLHATYTLADHGHLTLAEALLPFIGKHSGDAFVGAVGELAVHGQKER